MEDQDKDAIIVKLTWERERDADYIARLEKDNNECRTIIALIYKLTGFQVAPPAVDAMMEIAE